MKQTTRSPDLNGTKASAKRGTQLVDRTPTKGEITYARSRVAFPSTLSAMEGWEGHGWHEDEILYGIKIGLEIAKQRNGKANTTQAG